MATGLVEIMKIAAMDAMENKQICDLRFGTVATAKPVTVKVSNNFTIPASLLVVPEKLTDYEIEVTMDWKSEDKSGGSGDASFSSHKHDIKGKKKIIIHNALKVGDKVAMIRKTGGQVYYILDRLKDGE